MSAEQCVTPEDRPATVARCKRPGHTKHVAGCRGCADRSTFERRLLRWERLNGIDHGHLPTGPVRQHLEFLINHGNLMPVDIVAISGISLPTVRAVLYGLRETLYQITAQSLLAVQPRTQVRPPKAGMVPPTEGVRLVRGLSAQGWTGPHISRALGASSSTAHKMHSESREWMHGHTLERIRRVAAELGRYDIRDLDRPMPGMDVRVARKSARNGWVPLRAWVGRDITDPAAQPRDLDAEEAAALAPPPHAFIDPVLLGRVRSAAQKLDEITDQVRRATLWAPEPLAAVTVLEAHAVVIVGTRLGMSELELAMLLGYPHGSDKQRAAGKRWVSRIRAVTAEANRWVESDPWGDSPGWLAGTLNPAGRVNFSRFLPALLAVQDEPFGAGWDLGELAVRCAVDEADMVAFLRVASREADRMWRPRVMRAGRRRHRCAPRRAAELVAA